MEDNSRRAALEAAYDAQVTTTTPEPEAPAETVSTAPPGEAVETVTAPSPVADRPRDEAGRFTQKQKDEAAAAEKLATDKAAKKAPEGSPTAPATEGRKEPLTAADTQTEKPTKAPASWRPVEREAWAQVPKAAREAIERREREIEYGMREAAEARQNWTRFQEALRPFEPLMAMNNADPIRTTQNLFRTAAVLQQGTPAQKAGMLAQAILMYGVDPELVGAYLMGQAPQGGPPQGQPQQQQLRDPRVDQLLQRLEEAKQEKVAATQERLGQALTEFSQKAEWFEDVRETMADIIEVWDRQGKVNESNLTEVMRKAYDKAIRMDDGIAQALRQRQQAKQAAASQTSVQRSVAAASSVRSQPAVGGVAAPKSRREALERAYDAQVNRRA